MSQIYLGSPSRLPFGVVLFLRVTSSNGAFYNQ